MGVMDQMLAALADEGPAAKPEKSPRRSAKRFEDEELATVGVIEERRELSDVEKILLETSLCNFEDRRPHRDGKCDRCSSNETVRVSIHDGRSEREDCARCGRTVGFPVWYGF